MQYCSVYSIRLYFHHIWLYFQIHPQPSVISTLARPLHCFWSYFSTLYSFTVAYWAPSDLGGSSSRIVSLYLFVLFMRFLGQKYWSDLPFTSPVGHVWSELSTMTHLFWLALHGIWFTASLSYASHFATVIHEGEWNGNWS